MQEGYFGLAYFDQGLLMGSWNMEMEGLNEGDLFFMVCVKVIQGGLFSEMLFFNLEVIWMEVYDLVSGIFGFVFGFVQLQDVFQLFVLYQNELNFFWEIIVVCYIVLQVGDVIFILCDVAG